jgi:hypothetical protein
MAKTQTLERTKNGWRLWLGTTSWTTYEDTGTLDKLASLLIHPKKIVIGDRGSLDEDKPGTQLTLSAKPSVPGR